MPRYDDFRRSTGALEVEPDRWDADRFSRERHERLHPHGPPVVDRPRRGDDERFEFRLHENDRYGPPARRSDRDYEDDHLVLPSGPLVHRPRVESPPPRPRLLRRQSSLDTFDRIPSRKLDEYYLREYAPKRPPSPPPLRRRSFRRSREPDYYEDIRIAEPDFYGDEEYRGFRERTHHPRRSHSHVRERVVEEIEIEKPYPRKGRTRMPRKLVHPHAVREFGYPYEEEGDMVIIQLALSKEQIDDVIGRSREVKRRSEARVIQASLSPARARPRERTVERVAMETFSPRSSHNTLIVEASPSRHHSRSRHYDLEEKRLTRTVSRTRPVSIQGRPRRMSSPVHMITPFGDRIESDKVSASPLAIVVRPRDSEEDLTEYRQLQRRRSGDYVRDTEIIHSDGAVEEITEVKQDRRGPDSRILRAMMATLT
ncbi:hypothetical protein FE257_009978 [Aspergillus nanangensis]|uniref:DUF8035 domain-containing protein n=1 Tax=Aspergillus nanangensis TaxID=2582783 RepID=A0AAD4CXX4_ASPNN|nr:hypothetical protein FE257_009978 [Aspergillus nanangensis]